MVAFATILTMMQKHSPFLEPTRENIQTALDKLTEETQPKWGMMTAQHMVEHLEWQFLVATGKIKADIHTPEEHLEKYQDSLWNYRLMPPEYKNPMLRKDARRI